MMNERTKSGQGASENRQGDRSEHSWRDQLNRAPQVSVGIHAVFARDYLSKGLTKDLEK